MYLMGLGFYSKSKIKNWDGRFAYTDMPLEWCDIGLKFFFSYG